MTACKAGAVLHGSPAGPWQNLQGFGYELTSCLSNFVCQIAGHRRSREIAEMRSYGLHTHLHVKSWLTWSSTSSFEETSAYAQISAYLSFFVFALTQSSPFDSSFFPEHFIRNLHKNGGSKRSERRQALQPERRSRAGHRRR